MPTVRRYKPKRKTTTRRHYRKPYVKPRRYGLRYKRQQILYCPTAIPDRMRVKLTFATSGQHVITSVSAPTVIVATQYNPFGTAVNAQAWDQWASMYLSWRPLGMALRIRTGVLDNNALNPGANFRGYWSQYGSALGNDLAIIQNRYTKILELTNQSGWKTIKTYSKLNNVWGFTRQQWMTDPNTLADVTASPGRVTRYYMVWNCPYWTTSNNFNIGYEIIGAMYVEFSSPRILQDG